MDQLILWFNIMSFTLLFGAFGSTYVVYGRSNPPWLRSYLLYMATYALFVLFLTYHFFSVVYLPHPYPVLDSIAVYLSFAIALLLLCIVPRFIFSIIQQRAARWQLGLYVAMPVIFFLIFIAALFGNRQVSEGIGTIFFNGYMGLVTLYGLIRIRSSRSKVSPDLVVPFLYFSCIFYGVIVIQAIVLLFSSPSISTVRINILTSGLICFLWGAMTLSSLAQKIFKQDSQSNDPLPDEFLKKFNITAREREIIILLLQGESNRDIGEKLFVSPRTVETHIYNIYRKCSVKNKLGLANLISNLR